MKRWKRALCFVFTAALLVGTLQIFAAPDITLTVVNDQFLPLSASTMPLRKNGEIYVPYTVFSESLGMHSTYSEKQQLLILYNWDYTLNFSIAQGYVYDQNDKSYSQPPYSINGTTYVSVKLVCGVFGLSYSTISAAYPILRIANEDAVLSDHALVANATETMTRLVSAYLSPGKVPSTSGTPEPTIPVQPPKAEEKIPQPSLVYLIFVGALSESTADILDTLATYQRTATFFLPAQGGSLGEDMTRRIVSEGHSLGLSLTADASVADSSAMLSVLEQANTQLLFSCGVQTRLVSIVNGSDKLSQTQRNALADAGYRLWDGTLDAREDTRSAYRSAEIILNAFQKSTAPAVVQFRETAKTNDALRYILRYMRDTSINHAAIHTSTMPMNLVGEFR